MRTLILAAVTLTLPAVAAESLEPWAAKTQSSDATKQHVEEITKNQQHYAITQGGTVDGENCRTPLGCGMSREGVLEQSWESNRAVRLENVGESVVVNPWLSNGRNTYRNIGEIVSSAIQPEMKDHEKAMALWYQEIQHRYHWGGDNNEVGDPVKMFNVYGHNTCGNDSICLAGALHKAGIKVAPARAVGHCISQAFYDGRWHMLDGDQHAIYLLRDNETIAGEQDIVRDHDLIVRSHSQGLLFPDDRSAEQHMASLYVFEGEPTGDRNAKMDTTMNMTLRPGEAIVWRWGHLNPAKVHGTNPPLYPDTICNGLWEYRPDFSKDTWKKGALSAENVAAADGIVSAESGKTATIVWTIRASYVMVGGRIEAEPAGAKFSVSADGKTWQDAAANFDKFFPPGGAPIYEYQLKCQLSGEAQLKRLRIVNDLQMAPLTLPAMRVGENAFVYSDETTGERKVKITHDWVERSSVKPPAAPLAAVFPPADGECDGTDIVFQWTPPEGDKIDDYHFELANRADMKWPLSMTFCKLVSRTADKGKAQYSVPAGLLSPDKKYYWHVRAKNDKGAWGAWSKTFSFIAHAPAYPLDVAVDFDKEKNAGTLRWKTNPAGRAAVKYRVYGSDEKGFSISDAPYAVNVGVTKDLPPQFPANFIAEVTASELVVLGGDAGAAANKTYYRVVAVDEKGKRSGASEYAVAPRPVIFSKAAIGAKVGAEYKYQACANRSLGDLRLRVVGGAQTGGYWDIEKPKFSVQGPAWLKIDAATGMLSGTPDAAGSVDVVVTATIDRENRKLDEGALKWGNEKVVSTTTDRVGSAEQKFKIEVAP
jgi:hypothetical protein